MAIRDAVVPSLSQGFGRQVNPMEGSGTRDAPRGLASLFPELPVEKRFADPASPGEAFSRRPRSAALCSACRGSPPVCGRGVRPRSPKYGVWYAAGLLPHCSPHMLPSLRLPPDRLGCRFRSRLARACHTRLASTPRCLNGVQPPSMRDGCLQYLTGLEVGETLVWNRRD